jgi:hypothetical protein
MGANELSALLWRERELLDLLTFKLTEEQLLLTGGHARWLAHATAEVESTVNRLREAGLAREVQSSIVAQEWGIEGHASLGQIADAAPAGPWGDLLRAHMTAMATQAAQIQTLRDSNTNFLRAASRSTQETLASLHPESGTYDSHGVAGKETVTMSLLDTEL